MAARNPFDPERLGLRDALEMAGWSMLLPALKRIIPLRRLTALMWTAGAQARSERREQTVIALSARLSRARPRLQSNCLERSLLAYRFLARGGADPRLVVGVSNSDEAVFGHAWVMLDGAPIHEEHEALDRFAPLVEFGRYGRVTDLGQATDTILPRTWR